MIFLAPHTFDMWPPPLNTSLVIRLPVLLNGQMPPVFGDGWVCARRSGGAALADLLLLVLNVIPDENGAPQRVLQTRG